MIGNDIVDLEYALKKSRWQEQRFLDKLFSKNEQDFILSDDHEFEKIWKLWSMKESAYKIISRADGIVRFNPKDFNCFDINTNHGQVAFDNVSIPTVTLTTKDFVQTTAYLSPIRISKVFKLSRLGVQSQHKECYQHLVKAYAELKNIAQKTIEVIKSETGVPELYICGVLQKEHVSLTHHGEFGAIAITG